jgi:predicted amidohydrolase
MRFRIAVAQFRVTHQNPHVNMRRISRFVKKAVEKKANVVVFPEDCIMGSIFGDLRLLDSTHEARDFFVQLAKTHAIDIVTGTRMERTKESDRSVSYYIDRTGKILSRTAKHHLYPSECKFLDAGNEIATFNTEYGKAAIVICWDMLFPNLFQELKAQGVEIVYCPSFWSREIPHGMPKRDPRSEEKLIDALCVARAMETNSVVVYANAAGVMKYSNGERDTLIGHSQVVMPVQDALVRARHNREALLFADVDTALLRSSKKIYHGPVPQRTIF